MEAAKVDLHVRMPKELHERLVRLAAREHRSLNGQILAMLEQAAARHETEAKR